ncbi:MAG: YlbF family regulator [Syntrophaceticus sp.]|nr:YlbF family regulator [Syntrophaceticus sp.]MDD3313959.1 YlbF family regulator [Syntrophaceticus sp.]MDD4359036.1 YlbF family regulator [Syntrophaceticus sp.]MDD4782648.1 YlbF family regulator [Syntrophaceticus sp.]
MSVTEKAQELGFALRETNEAKQLQVAEMDLDNDNTSRQLIEEFQQLFQKLQKAQEDGKDIAQNELDEFNALQEKVKADNIIQNYFAAQQRFNQLLQEANNVINQVLRGESCSTDCCDGCSGCS